MQLGTALVMDKGPRLAEESRRHQMLALRYRVIAKGDGVLYSSSSYKATLSRFSPLIHSLLGYGNTLRLWTTFLTRFRHVDSCNK